MASGSRRLEVSDFMVEKETSIKENPYQFLNLPENADPVESRRAYIRLAKLYHPDMIRAKDEKTAKLAHERMVLINRAYQEIKSRHGPEKWNELFGYDFESVFDEVHEVYYKAVNLEGPGTLSLYDKHFEYWVSGPYLLFDYGQDPDHPWEWGYQGGFYLRHMFANMQINDGMPVDRILIEPIIDCFNLDGEQGNRLVDMLSSGKSTEFIMKELGIPHDHDINLWSYDDRSDYDSDRWLYSLRFRRHINEITALSTEPTWEEQETYARLEDDKLVIRRVSENIFSMADYYLFLTLAYGPMLTQC